MSITVEIDATSPEQFEAYMRALGYVKSSAIKAEHRPAPSPIVLPTPYGSVAGKPADDPVFSWAMTREQAEAVGLVPTEPQPTEIVKGDGPAGVVTVPPFQPNGASNYAPGDVISVIVEGPPGVLATPQGFIASEFGGLREHGKPSPGRQRRTSKEVAEDMRWAAQKRAAQDAAVAEQNARAFEQDEPYVAVESSAVDEQFEAGEDEAAISTGEERIDPAQAEEQAALDAEDEAAEDGVGEPDQLTHDDLRHVIGEYTKLVGIARAAREVKQIIGCGLDEIPNTQEALMEAIDKMADAYALQKKNTNNESPEPVITERQAFTRDDVMNVIKDYAQKFDGTTDFKAAAIMQKDVGAVVREVAGVEALRLVPDTSEMNEKLYQAIYGALTSNRFKRTVVSNTVG